MANIKTESASNTNTPADFDTGISEYFVTRLEQGGDWTVGIVVNRNVYIQSTASSLIATVHDQWEAPMIAQSLSLARAVYFLGGGRTWLEMHGRLCFCRAFYVKKPKWLCQHTTACDDLWRAFQLASLPLAKSGKCDCIYLIGEQHHQDCARYRKPKCDNGDCPDHYGDNGAWCQRCWESYGSK